MTPAAARVCSVTLGRRTSCAGIFGESTGVPSVTTHQMLDSSSPSQVIRAVSGTIRPASTWECLAVAWPGLVRGGRGERDGVWSMVCLYDQEDSAAPLVDNPTVVGAGATTASDRLGDPLMLPIGD